MLSYQFLYTVRLHLFIVLGKNSSRLLSHHTAHTRDHDASTITSFTTLSAAFSPISIPVSLHLLMPWQEFQVAAENCPSFFFIRFLPRHDGAAPRPIVEKGKMRWLCLKEPGPPRRGSLC